MALTPQYQPIILGGKEYQLRLFDADMLEDFVRRFKDAPLREFAAYAKEAGLPAADVVAFQRDHFRHPPTMQEILDAYLATGEGMAYFLFLGLASNEGVTEEWVKSNDWDEAEVQYLFELQGEHMQAMAQKKTSATMSSTAASASSTTG